MENTIAQRSTRYQSVARTTNGRCWYCGKMLGNNPESNDYGVVDHVVPSCRSCNASKGKKSVEQYRQKILEKAFPEARAIAHLKLALTEMDGTEEVDQIQQSIARLESKLPKIKFWGETRE